MQKKKSQEVRKKNLKTLRTDEAKKTKTIQAKTKQSQLQESKDKYGIKVPSRLNPLNDELSLETDPFLLSLDRKFSIFLSDKTVREAATHFVRLPTAADVMITHGHLLINRRICPASACRRKTSSDLHIFDRAPDTFIAHLCKLGELWFLYRSFHRTDDYTILEKFFKRASYMKLPIMRDRCGKETIHGINDLMSIAPVLAANEISKHPSMRFRRTVSCEPHALSYRRAQIGDAINSACVRNLMLVEGIRTIRKAINEKLMNHEYEGMKTKWKPIRDKLKKFKCQNISWYENRLKMNRTLIQLPLDTIKGNKIPKLDMYSFLNEYHCLPPSYTHEYFVGQAVRDKVRKDEDILHVRPSIYTHKPTPVSFIEGNESNMTVALSRFHEEAEYCEYLSGCSSNSQCSTATVSPGNWMHNRKYHERPSKLEHRSVPSEFPDEVEEREKGETELSKRRSRLLEKKIAAINNLGKCDDDIHTRFHWSNFVEVDDDVTMMRSDKREIATRRKKIEAATKAAKSCSEQEALEYALAQIPDSPYVNLDINPTWKHYIDAGIITVTDQLKMLMKVDSWVTASPMDTTAVAERCDRMMVDRH